MKWKDSDIADPEQGFLREVTYPESPLKDLATEAELPRRNAGLEQPGRQLTAAMRVESPSTTCSNMPLFCLNRLSWRHFKACSAARSFSSPFNKQSRDET